jgi:uncharacterized protein YbjT (DUF2867 family)
MIVITAPTGRIGRRLLPLLLPHEPVRVIVRDPVRLPAEIADQVEIVTGSHGDQETVIKAFEGADAVFWLPTADPRAAGIEEAFVDFTRPAVEALRRHGVPRVVGVSALGRGTAVAGRAGHVTGSLAMDDLIGSSGVHYRALALPTFMDNVAWQAGSIMADGVLTAPMPGDLKAPVCATGDIAAAAARLLLDRDWTGVAEVPLLGPEDLSQEDLAMIISEVLRRPVRFERTPDETYLAQLIERGISPAMAQAMLDMAHAKTAGLDHGVARTAETSSPTTFRQWCADVLLPAVSG